MNHYERAVEELEFAIAETKESLADKENNHGSTRTALRHRIDILKRCIRAIKAAQATH